MPRAVCPQRVPGIEICGKCMLVHVHVHMDAYTCLTPLLSHRLYKYQLSAGPGHGPHVRGPGEGAQGLLHSREEEQQGQVAARQVTGISVYLLS